MKGGVEVKIAICEDEKYQREIMQQYILEHREYDSNMEISAFSSGEAFLDACAAGEKYDILFLDIQMAGVNGIEVAHEKRKKNKNTIIFFITGFAEYVSDAFVVDAFQFLQKPVRKELFDREFSRALKKYYTQNKLYPINDKSKLLSLKLQEIVYLEVLVREIIIHTTSGKYSKIGKMDAEEKQLFPYGFIRIHRTYLVNMNHIASCYLLMPHKMLFINENARRRPLDPICLNDMLSGNASIGEVAEEVFRPQ